MNLTIEISIIIPVKNGAKTLKRCLENIYNQSVINKTEVIIIDSGSKDKSIEIIKKFPVRLFKIPPKEFGHGKTRNFGVSKANGKFIVMTVQDAAPTSEFWLEELIKCFDNENVAGVCGQQIVPHEKDKNPAQWFRPFSEPKIKEYKFPKKEDFLTLSPQEQRNTCGWDDVNAAYKKTIFDKNNFRNIDFAEDLFWAKDVIMKGYTLKYNPKARVFHYHHETFISLYKRVMLEYKAEYKLFRYKRKALNYILKIPVLIKLVLISKISLFEKIKWIIYNIKISISRTVALLIFSFNLSIKKEKNDL